ncbi:MAG: hypothetical protein M1274_15380 [Actinobacteria bacterium]|nr:hypothetical protein [Actinomycetota bacterium]
MSVPYRPVWDRYPDHYPLHFQHGPHLSILECEVLNVAGALVGAAPVGDAPPGIKKLVEAECAGYYAPRHTCDGPKGGTCVFWREEFDVCGCFEASVLPQNREVEHRYRDWLGMPRVIVVPDKVCPQCDSHFKGTHNRRTYCSERCREQARKDQYRAAKKRSRAVCADVHS